MANSSGKTVVEIKLKTIEGTPENFEEFGQVIGLMPDDKDFAPQAAQMVLSQGTPRFRIMSLGCRSLKFSSIMHHPRVTQCFGSIGGHVWYLGVAKPSLLDPDQVEGDRGSNVVQSHDGHFYMPPAIEDVRVFRFSGRKFVKLNMGTWHAGPLFDPQMKMDFYNLELSNTHHVEQTTHYFRKDCGEVKNGKVMFTFVE
ncbi:hypothetical protein DCAR_0521896 [Daucus carota subsp. sativus]|uniref:Ureidoglycolate hydrolase n=1 Tax=Daucus carota subsp. sativus TaxID=79200 RepID=A0AAF0X8N8_DAUCS|nr:PREDICTED: uncharacterized protein LOC108220704 [Daucus carota subsp. sativus]WOH02507.1 hypothetical protein DCAR_0521896 [Daucus carota subsp. sativus]